MIAKFDTGEHRILQIGTNIIAYSFLNYKGKPRFVTFEDGSKDTRFWQVRTVLLIQH